jgi:acetyl/propionyl-CoA carboxylase alpha subunit
MSGRFRPDRVDRMTIVTIRQGTTDDPPVMTTAARRTPADRDHAVARLRTMTIGTGIAGVLAVGAFGALAAASDDGTSGDVTTAALATTDTSTSTTSGTTTDAATTSTTTSTDSTTTTTQATTAPTAATGSAHAATGSS